MSMEQRANLKELLLLINNNIDSLKDKSPCGTEASSVYTSLLYTIKNNTIIDDNDRRVVLKKLESTTMTVLESLYEIKDYLEIVLG